jgi:hypothetical protein
VEVEEMLPLDGSVRVVVVHAPSWKAQRAEEAMQLEEHGAGCHQQVAVQSDLTKCSPGLAVMIGLLEWRRLLEMMVVGSTRVLPSLLSTVKAHPEGELSSGEPPAGLV